MSTERPPSVRLARLLKLSIVVVMRPVYHDVRPPQGAARAVFAARALHRPTQNARSVELPPARTCGFVPPLFHGQSRSNLRLLVRTSLSDRAKQVDTIVAK